MKTDYRSEDGKCTKKCITCELHKDPEMFHVDRQKRDGRHGECKECKGLRDKDRGLYYAKYNKTEKSKESKRKYKKRYRENENNKHKIHARREVSRAIKNGKLIKPVMCSKCGDEGIIHSHHNDYSKPLNIVWLCHKCHSKLHVALRKENRTHPENEDSK